VEVGEEVACVEVGEEVAHGGYAGASKRY
jgi:hypothetical protein